MDHSGTMSSIEFPGTASMSHATAQSPAAPAPCAPSLTRKPSSALKTEGWSSFVRAMTEAGPLLVTHRNRPEAVIISPQEYERLLAIAQRERERRSAALAELDAEFDARLASLRASDADARMDRFLDEPVRLGGRLRAGEGF